MIRTLKKIGTVYETLRLNSQTAGLLLLRKPLDCHIKTWIWIQHLDDKNCGTSKFLVAEIVKSCKWLGIQHSRVRRTAYDRNVTWNNETPISPYSSYLPRMLRCICDWNVFNENSFYEFLCPCDHICFTTLWTLRTFKKKEGDTHLVGRGLEMQWQLRDCAALHILIFIFFRIRTSHCIDSNTNLLISRMSNSARGTGSCVPSKSHLFSSFPFKEVLDLSTPSASVSLIYELRACCHGPTQSFIIVLTGRLVFPVSDECRGCRLSS